MVEIARCAAVCRETLDWYGPEDPEAEHIRSELLLVTAALETAVTLDDDDHRYEASLMIAATLARKTAAVLRGRSAADRLASCAAACERAAAACETALRRPGPEA